MYAIVCDHLLPATEIAGFYYMVLMVVSPLCACHYSSFVGFDAML